jgi:hypothetical protein
MAKDKKKLGTIAYARAAYLNELIDRLENTTIGDIENRITVLENNGSNSSLEQRIMQNEKDIEELQSRKGLCPQSLII